MKLLYPSKNDFFHLHSVCIEKKMSAPIAEDVSHYKELFIGVIDDFNRNNGFNLKYTEVEYKLLRETKQIMAEIEEHKKNLELKLTSSITMANVSLNSFV